MEENETVSERIVFKDRQPIDVSWFQEEVRTL